MSRKLSPSSLLPALFVALFFSLFSLCTAYTYRVDDLIYGGGGLVGLAILVLDIMAIVEILDRSSGRDAFGKAVWIIFILLAPLISLVVYILIGRRGQSNYHHLRSPLI